MTRVLLTSVGRITPFLPEARSGVVQLGEGFSLAPIPKERWATGDYVVGRVRAGSPLHVPFELASGRMVEVGEGDLVMGALGRREATLEAVGSWQAVGSDRILDALTPAGLLGRMTSKSDRIPDLVRLDYRGHVHVQERPLAMADCVGSAPAATFALPVVLIVGSSMSAGKTTTGRAIVRLLRESGRSVVAAKLTGAARYRDVLSLGDAGADWIFDFVDAGLPSSVCDSRVYRQALDWLLRRMAAVPADVAVFEAGASPLEPYNGATAVEMLEPHVRCTVLCASDPYAVVGITSAFARRPDVVSGPTANTEAGIELVRKLSGIPALDARGPRGARQLREILERCLAAGCPGRMEPPAAPVGRAGREVS